MLINEALNMGMMIYVDQLVVEAYDSYINEIKNIQVLRYQKRDLLERIRYAGTLYHFC